MTHEDAGHYGAKHPDGKVDTAIAEKIQNRQKNGRITCAAAHEIADKLNCSPQEVGLNIDLLEKRINQCQLGLFGYGDKKGKAIEAASTVAEELKTALRDAMGDDRITCEAAWEVADRLNLSRMAAAGACESLGIKISACQLGAF